MLRPTAHEATNLQFSRGQFSLNQRYALAFASGLAGAAMFVFAGGTGLRTLGVAAIIAAHVLVWVKSITTAPGGATPSTVNAWVPVDEEWITKLRDLEARGKRWDITPWDISCRLGFLTMIIVVGTVLAAIGYLSDPFGGPGGLGDRLGILSLLLLLPLWLNGMRTSWNPSELFVKAQALLAATMIVREEAGDRFEVVPMLALCEGPRGKYPVDARMMLRPRDNANGDFIGIQVQVSINSVQGQDYPYLYCVILVKEPALLPQPGQPKHNLVFEPGSGDGAYYLVIRNYADNAGGWHTTREMIDSIVRTALELSKGLN